MQGSFPTPGNAKRARRAAVLRARKEAATREVRRRRRDAPVEERARVLADAIFLYLMKELGERLNEGQHGLDLYESNLPGDLFSGSRLTEADEETARARGGQEYALRQVRQELRRRGFRMSVRLCSIWSGGVYRRIRVSPWPWVLR